jgi:uncharacterized damage-inducible protein DinB
LEQQWKSAVWSQFGAAIDMLERALAAIPDEMLVDRRQSPELWYVVYHTLFWLDLYLTGSVEGFQPPDPFGLEELDPSGLMPETPIDKPNLRAYLEHCREKCRSTLARLTDERAGQVCTFGWGSLTFAELLIYNMRHVQDHAGQLNHILGQTLGEAPSWVGRASDQL